MEILICRREGCNQPVAESKRSDSFYCNPNCGAAQRYINDKIKDKEKLPHSRQIEANYKIIRDLYNKGDDDVLIESLELLGFDFNYCTGVDDFDNQTGIMKFKLFEFILTSTDNRYTIKKLSS
jgi:hypothetical protein